MKQHPGQAAGVTGPPNIHPSFPGAGGFLLGAALPPLLQNRGASRWPRFALPGAGLWPCVGPLHDLPVGAFVADLAGLTLLVLMAVCLLLDAPPGEPRSRWALPVLSGIAGLLWGASRSSLGLAPQAQLAVGLLAWAVVIRCMTLLQSRLASPGEQGAGVRGLQQRDGGAAERGGRVRPPFALLTLFSFALAVRIELVVLRPVFDRGARPSDLAVAWVLRTMVGPLHGLLNQVSAIA